MCGISLLCNISDDIVSKYVFRARVARSYAE